MKASAILPRLTGLALFGLCALHADPLDATIYRYELEDGTVLYTTEPRTGQTPSDVIGDMPARQSATSAREARRMREMPTPPTRPNPNPNRSPNAFDDIIAEAAAAYSIPFELIKAVIRAESGFDPHAISHVGAQGLMQLMPRTARSLNCDDPFDPRENIMAGTQYLRILTDRFGGDMNLILAAYNAGTGTVNRVEGIPYEATRRYIERVWQYYGEYLDASRRAASEQ
ncbi:MAG: lytic transglycosylase domain-containing protein [Deltaproteobacteria bacterium]|nr:MAG: lytic transglycosylase domain-containing protein [Deltaproteobacteria bacterium]